MDHKAFRGMKPDRSSPPKHHNSNVSAANVVMLLNKDSLSPIFQRLTFPPGDEDTLVY